MLKVTKQFTEKEIEAGMSRKGGFTRAQLKIWGVPWPPPKGWRHAITLRPMPETPASPLPRWANPKVTRRHEASAISDQERRDASEAWPEFPLARFWFNKPA